MLRFSLQHKILVGYIILVSVIFCMTLTILYEKHQIQKIESETFEIRTLRQNINTIHRYITKLSISGESVIDWDEIDYRNYQINRLHTDSLLQAMKPYCINYVQPQQIDTLRILLTNKEAHLRHIMDVLKRQAEADSLLINHLPEVAKRAIRVCTVQQKKKGIAGFFGGKKTVQVLPSAQELHEFSDSLITLQRKQTAEMDAYADSLRTLGKRLNVEMNRLITELDGQAQEAFVQKERKIAEAQVLSVRLFTVTISAAIVLLFLSYLTIHRELKRNDYERKQREKLIGELQESNDANEKLIRLRRNLIRNISHELRTPLSGISGNAELLLKDEEADNRIRHAEAVMSSAGRMAAMIDSLLEYFRLDCGKVSLVRKPFRLGSIAETLEAEFAPLAAGKRLAFSFDNSADGIVKGDKGRILGIGANLLSNAIKYTPNGKVSLATGYTDGIFTLTVEDTGTGMREEQQERIFMPFERLGNAATQEKQEGSPPRIAGRSVLVIDNDNIILGMMRDMFASGGVDCDCRRTDGSNTHKRLRLADNRPEDARHGRLWDTGTAAYLRHWQLAHHPRGGNHRRRICGGKGHDRGGICRPACQAVLHRRDVCRCRKVPPER